ncbi:Uncharacterised protein [Bordetella pertussis]|nr:Uncharacterised protein [Bordetella pertussis]
MACRREASSSMLPAGTPASWRACMAEPSWCSISMRDSIMARSSWNSTRMRSRSSAMAGSARRAGV